MYGNKKKAYMTGYFAVGVMVIDCTITSKVVCLPFYSEETLSNGDLFGIANKLCELNGLDYMYHVEMHKS